MDDTVGPIGDPGRVPGPVAPLLEPVRARLGEALFHRVAGPDGPAQAARIHGTPGPRRFGPDSAIVRVHGDASMFVGGIRALMFQALHPVAMTAVGEHSGYRGDMWGRLARTSTFLATTTFGTVADAERAIAAVNRIHRSITGTMPDGTPYRADDPHLLAWVHAAEIDSFLLAHQTYGAEPLDDAGRDAYVAETAWVARGLGVPDPPTSALELAQVLDAYRPELASTAYAREAVSYLLLRPPLPLAARPAYGVLAAAAVGLMPRWSRLPLRLPYLPVSERTVVRALGTVATGTIRWAMSPGRDARAALQATHPA